MIIFVVIKNKTISLIILCITYRMWAFKVAEVGWCKCFSFEYRLGRSNNHIPLFLSKGRWLNCAPDKRGSSRVVRESSTRYIDWYLYICSIMKLAWIIQFQFRNRLMNDSYENLYIFSYFNTYCIHEFALCVQIKI